MIFLTVPIVKRLHRFAITTSGGEEGHDETRLSSSVGSVSHGYHRTLAETAAAYAFNISQSHPFVDGNKRTAVLAAITFLGLNHVHIRKAQTRRWYATMMLVARGEMKRDRLARFFQKEIATVRSTKRKPKRRPPRG